MPFSKIYAVANLVNTGKSSDAENTSFNYHQNSILIWTSALLHKGCSFKAEETVSILPIISGNLDHLSHVKGLAVHFFICHGPYA